MNNRTIVVQCKACGVFVPGNTRRRFCGGTCRQRAWQEKRKKETPEETVRRMLNEAK